MITPLEIQNKDFKRNFRGYNTKLVDSFLDEIIEDYERLYKENIELKDKVNMLADQIRQYNTLEETLKNTLIVAQSTADEVTTTARKKAENIIEEAEANGRETKYKAREDVRKIRDEYENIKREIYISKTRYKSFIEAQLLSLEDFYQEIDKCDKDSNFYNDKKKDNEEEYGVEKESNDIHDLGAQ